MKLSLGIKSDPIDHRYTYEWLFDLMAEAGVKYMQLGSFFEMYFLEPDWFHRLREKAEERGLRIKSVFTAYRELGGFMSGDPALEQATIRNYRRMLEVARELKVDFAGSNMGAVFYDRKDYKAEGLRRCVAFIKEMTHIAGAYGLRGLTIEPMSCLAEPPTLASECAAVMEEFAEHRRANPAAAPVYFCGDISHGYADAAGKVVEDNWSLFEGQIPAMCEFHFKNTDAVFGSTFGFGPGERERGIVALDRFRALVDANAGRFPVEDVTGYLELNHVKFGRDYTDPRLGTVLRESIAALKEHFAFQD